nr:secA translation cis-regulator SecM [uncultured Haemophilus sp.]
MSLFNHFHRKPLLSQFLLGILAIFALPEIQVNHESEQTIINQPLIQAIAAENDQEQHSLFLAELKPEILKAPQQAVQFTPFFAKAFHFDGDLNHPIRAGPNLFIA